MKIWAARFAIRTSWGRRQSYALLRSINTVATTPDVSKHFYQFFNNFKRAFCKECPFLNLQSFGENILLTTVLSCE